MGWGRVGCCLPKTSYRLLLFYFTFYWYFTVLHTKPSSGWRYFGYSGYYTILLTAIFCGKDEQKQGIQGFRKLCGHLAFRLWFMSHLGFPKAFFPALILISKNKTKSLNYSKICFLIPLRFRQISLCTNCTLSC